MHQSEASEAAVRLLFKENPAGAKEKDKVCAAAIRFLRAIRFVPDTLSSVVVAGTKVAV